MPKLLKLKTGLRSLLVAPHRCGEADHLCTLPRADAPRSDGVDLVHDREQAVRCQTGAEDSQRP